MAPYGVVHPVPAGSMENFGPGPAAAGVIVPAPQVHRLAVAAYLARFEGQSRIHIESDLPGYLTWCKTRGLVPLAATRPHIEVCVRWLQEVRRFKPSTVSRRMSVVAGFYRTCVIDDVLPHSPAEYVRRPNVPAESSILGLTHLQFEALLSCARESTNQFDFALVTMLGLLGRRICEATGSDIEDLGEEHGHRVLRVHGKGDRIVLVPLPPAGGATRRLRRLTELAGVKIAKRHPHMLRHIFVTTMPDAGVDLRDVQIAARHADPRTTMRYDRARQNLNRQHPNYILATYMAAGT